MSILVPALVPASAPALASDPMRSGLGVDIQTPKGLSELSGLPYTTPASGNHPHRASVVSISEASSSSAKSAIMRTRSDESYNLLRLPASEASFPLRSVRGMQGLLLAENGGGLVELDTLGSGSGFKEGTQVIPGLVTPSGGTFGATENSLVSFQNTQGSIPSRVPSNRQRLCRQGTLLSQGATPARNAAELKSLLGNSRSKVKSGAKILPPPNTPVGADLPEVTPPAVALEQGKSRARVEVDILLDNAICVEGTYLTGNLHVKVRKQGTKDPPIFLGGGKIRVVGFEGIPDNNDRHTFYQHAASLYAISSLSHVLYASPPDEEGFCLAREGMHVIPFAMKLPVSDGIHVGAKGPFDNLSGVVVKYIVIASFKLKDKTTARRSIAHFYRSCEVYPYLNASIVMAPTSRPLLSTASRRIFLGGPGKLKLTASLHRNFWVAGQRCCVGIAVQNETKKSVKGLILSLIRTTTVFHPHPHLDVAASDSADPDACQTTTTRKLVAETTLDAGQRGLKGHVTAKGWWTGVEPGARMNFVHFILLPPNALSIVRSRLLEVQYDIRVSLVAGSLSSEVSVMLPVRILNHLSIDPPPSYLTLFGHPSIPVAVASFPDLASDPTVSIIPPCFQGTSTHEADRSRRTDGGGLASIFDGYDARDPGSSSGGAVASHQVASDMPGPLALRMPLPKLVEEHSESEPSPNGADGIHEYFEETIGPQEIRDSEDESAEHEGDETMGLCRNNADDTLGNLCVEDSDEEADFVVGSARLEDDGQSTTKFTEYHVEAEQESFTTSTVSSRSTYSMPSADYHLSQQPILEEVPAQKIVDDDSVPAGQSPLRVRPRTLDLNRDLSGSSGKNMKPSPSRSDVANTAQTRGGLCTPYKSSTAALSHNSPFSRRVDRLITARRAGIKTPIANRASDSSDRDGATEGTGTQRDTSSSEMPPASSLTLPTQLATPHRLGRPTSSSKMPVPVIGTSVSQTASSVRSRIAELEGMSKAVSSSRGSSVYSRPHSFHLESIKSRSSADSSLSDVGDARQVGDRKLSYKAPLLRYTKAPP